MMTDGKITKKYGTTGFMYTEYPHKRFWHQGHFNEQFFEKVTDTPAMLYVHIPYCEKLCYFCTCHMQITQDYSKVERYLELLYREIDLLGDYRFNIKEVHLGGGSPTILKKEEFSRLIAKLWSLADLDKLDEFSIEVDPRRVDKRMMHFYADMGISRISFGIQDFDPQVQDAVNRPQPAVLTERLIVPEIRSRFKNGVNFDIICGLPKQTTTTMQETCQEILRLSPDRICLNYLHYSPEMAKHQKLMGELPNFEQRKALFQEALGVLTLGGYMRTGYDHFALPTDANAKATMTGNAGWNSLGTTPGRVQDTLGIGVSSISQIGNTYYQNYYDLNDYKESLNKGELPIYRGYMLSKDDVRRREIIQQLRNYFVADVKSWECFAKALPLAQEFEKDGLIVISGTKIAIREPEYANLVCRIFDEYYDGERMAPDLGEYDVE